MMTYWIILLIAWSNFLIPNMNYAGGISVDAGLPPGEDRWIVRLQYRYIDLKNTNMRLQNHVIPFIVSYGVTPDFTFMTRFLYVNQIIDQNSQSKRNGVNDPFFLLKYMLIYPQIYLPKEL